MSEEAKRWKEKYLTKLDEVEAITHSFKEERHILERLLVRVSLAAEGLDKNLDDHLDSLRNSIRKNAGPEALRQQLESIENKVLTLDQEQEGTAEGVLRALSRLVDQLLACDISRTQKKSLKAYVAQMSRRVGDLRQYPALLEEFGKMQGYALAELVQKEAREGDGGFLRRLFKPRSDAPRPEAAVSVGTIPSISLETVPHVPSEKTEQLVKAGQIPAGSADSEYASVAYHLCSTLDSLIEHLQLPGNMEEHAREARDKIANGMSWYELAPTLDDIANLIISAFCKGQKDFESFLKLLDERLASLKSFLELNRSSQKVSADNKAELNQVMHDHVNSIQQDVHAVKDISLLETTVRSNLDSILVFLEQYMQKENDREDELASEIAEMQERLQSMEKDSQERQRELAEQQQKAMTDILTDLPNRAAYEERMEIEYERWKRYGNPLTLVIADIDHFKNVNDRFGHLSGDKVIQLIGKEVSHRIRKTDFMARFGGEEFVILLPETVAEVGFTVMNKAREMIARMPFHFQDQKVQITISMGLCEFREGASISEVFELADKALYRAKTAGRNQLLMADFTGPA